LRGFDSRSSRNRIKIAPLLPPTHSVRLRRYWSSMPFLHASSALSWKAGAVLSQVLVLSLISRIHSTTDARCRRSDRCFGYHEWCFRCSCAQSEIGRSSSDLGEFRFSSTYYSFFLLSAMLSFDSQGMASQYAIMNAGKMCSNSRAH